MNRVLLFWCVAFVAISSAAQPVDVVTLDPCPCRENALFGEVSGDNVTDLRDLAILGRLWEDDEAKETVGRKRESLLQDIQENWLRALASPIASANADGLARTPLLSGEPTRQALLVASKSNDRSTFLKRFGVTSDPKQAQVGPDRMGTTVKVSPRNAAPQYTNLRAFKSPASFSLAERRRYFPNDVFSRLNGGFSEATPNGVNEEITSITENRYNYAVGASGARLKYISSFEDAIDAFGLDVNVAATYSLFSGSVDLGIDTSTVTNERRHTVIVTLTKSFGWEEASDEVFSDLLTPNFLEDLAKARPGDEFDPTFDFESVWGTHLVIAQHLVAELLIRVDFETVSRVDKSEFKLAVEAAFKGAGSSVSLGTAISTLKQNVKGTTNVSVSVDVYGAPDTVLINEQPVSIAGELAAGIQSGANPQRVAELISAWDLELRRLAEDGAVLGAPNDYLYIPLTILLDESLNPFSAQQNLRNWYLRWLDMETQLLFLQDALDTRNNKFSEPYDYFRFVSAGFEGFDNPYDYAADVLQLTQERYLSLFEKGKRLYQATEDDPEIFLPGDENFQVPHFDLPRPLLLPTGFTLKDRIDGGPVGGNCDAGSAAGRGHCTEFLGALNGGYFTNQSVFVHCNEQSAEGFLEIFNFEIPSDSNRYQMRWVYEPIGVNIYEQPYKAEPGLTRGMGVSPAGVGFWSWRYVFGSKGCENDRWSSTDSWGGNSVDWAGLIFYLLDTQTNEIVAFTCASDGNCSSEEIEIVLQAGSF